MEKNKLAEKLTYNCDKMQRKAFSKGSIITTYMEKRKQICILVSGKAELIRYDRNGNRDIIETFKESDIFGEAFYPVNTNNELFVLATKECEVLIFLYDDLRIKCKQNCSFHTTLVSTMLELVLNNTISQNTRIEILSKRSIRENCTPRRAIIKDILIGIRGQNSNRYLDFYLGHYTYLYML